MANFADYSRFVVTLLAILTPFAAIPVFLALTSGQDDRFRARTADMAATTVFIVLVVSALTGDVLLRILGTSLDAFRVGGGIVLFLMSLSMLNARVSAVQQTPEEADEAGQKSALGVVPIGIPLLVGPGSISSTIIETRRNPEFAHLAAVVVCIGLVCLVVWITLRLADPIGRQLGRTGLNILNRIFGLLLAAIAVQIVSVGLVGLFPALAGLRT
ncbi:MAG: NAAT family transporter [Alphaproteobacteria bacterium]|nr:NAAT family transporter [Alphaproteobacteria bacterium]